MSTTGQNTVAFVTTTKALPPEVNAKLRLLAREVIDRDFKGVVSQAAAALPKISHSLLFEFLSGQRGAGISLLKWLSGRTGLSIGQLMDEAPIAGRPQSPSTPTDPLPARAIALAPFANHPDPLVRKAVEATREALALGGHLDRDPVEWSRRLLLEIDIARARAARPSTRDIASELDAITEANLKR